MINWHPPTIEIVGSQSWGVSLSPPPSASSREAAGLVPRALWHRSDVQDCRVGQSPDDQPPAGLPPAADDAHHPRGERVGHSPAHARHGAVSRGEGVSASKGTAPLRAPSPSAVGRPALGRRRDSGGGCGEAAAKVRRTYPRSGKMMVTTGGDQLLSLPFPGVAWMSGLRRPG